MRGKSQWLWVAVAALMLVLVGVRVNAAPPSAGTQIGNQASATYTDGEGQARQTTSNLAVTRVEQVPGLLLVQSQTKIVSPGGQVVFAHLLTNTGNGTDTFTLAQANLPGDFVLTDVHIYPDADANGEPDVSSDIATSGPLSAGGTFGFVVVGTVPASATGGQFGRRQVTATSGFLSSLVETNTDTAQVSEQAVVNITKDTILNSGNPGTTNSYRLNYANTGNNVATNLTVTDTIPVGMSYVSGSGRWSVTGATVLTDGAGGDTGIDYQYDSLNRRITAVIGSVARGGAGNLTFSVVVNSNQGPGTIDNIARFSYGDGSGGPTVTNQESNIARFEVNQLAGVTMGPTNTIDAIGQGGVLVYTNTVTNTGNGSDAFNITIQASTFPAGSGQVLYQSDGNTPMVDTDNDGGVDTGLIATGATYNVILKVTLPPGATGGPFSLTKRAASHVNPAVTATEVDRLVAITSSSVDLCNNSPASAGVPGFGPGAEVNAAVTNAANPGTTTRFTLYVNNTGPVADTFGLSVTNSLPAGWTVTFRSSAEAVITSTGLISPLGNQLVYADVAVPANALVGAQEVFFRALSPTTAASDVLHDRVAINVQHAIAITPNQNGQVTAPGTITYVHQVCNNGNTNETVTLSSTNSASAAGWTTVLYVDANNNNVVDASDPLASTVTLAPFTCTNVLAKVFAPEGAPVGAVNTTTISGTTAGATATAAATDTTTVIASNVTITKEQGRDTTCTGGAVTYTSTQISAPPGACVRYRITVRNNGVTPVTNVHVYDSTPAYTIRFDVDGVPTVTGGSVNTFTGPDNNSAGAFDFTVGTLAGNATAVIEFQVKINQ